MKRLAYLPVCSMFFLTILTACNQTKESKTVNGIVSNASMNNITVITNQGDTVNINTTDANPQDVPGVLLNDSVEIICVDTVIDGVKLLKATNLKITAQSPYYYIQGTWLEPNPIAPDQKQGFCLNQDGTASSINMATLLMKKWSLDDKTLTLQYESVGNKLSFEGIDTLGIVKLNADSLILENKGNVVWRLAREK